jgi:hypothetical protein
LLRYIGGLLALTILLVLFFGFQQYFMSQQFNEMAMNLTNLELLKDSKQNSKEKLPTQHRE